MEDEKTITFGIPKGEIKQAYFDLILKQMYHLGLQISQPTTYNAGNIPLMVNFIISHIPSQNNRDDMRLAIKTEIARRLENIEDDETIRKITVDVYIEYVGQISDYLEKFMGIQTENRLGFIGMKQHEKK